MGEMRDSDWSRPILLRSDWLGLIGSIMTTVGKDVLGQKLPEVNFIKLFQV